LTNKGITRLATIDVAGERISKVTFQRKIVKRDGEFDAAGKLVLPGFIDCHCHMFSVGEMEKEVKLFGSSSIRDFQKRITDFGGKAKFLQPHEWLFGRGWDQDRFEEKRMPSRQDLDEIQISRPMIMVRVCGHIAVMNSLARDWLERAGVFIDTAGKATGIVKETTLSECWRALNVADLTEIKENFLIAQKKALQFGITSVHCILSENWRNELDALRELDTESRLSIKTSLLLPIESLEFVESLELEKQKFLFNGRRFAVTGFKLFADGSLGARTAALKEPYSDDPNNIGIMNYKDEQIVSIAKRVKKLHLVLAVHAIGDRAIEQVIDCFRSARVSKKHSFRIEHVSVVNKSLVAKLSTFVLCIQPMFASSDDWIRERIGTNKEKRFAYPFKSLGKRSTLIAGSDAPVETLNPLESIEAASHNKVDARESLTLSQSLSLYTSTASQASKLTRKTGEIRSGMYCDLVVTSAKDIEELFAAKAIQVFASGERINL
jgi:predicted amidohydrolase YtcJ